jgi:hypothetical protein
VRYRNLDAAWARRLDSLKRLDPPFLAFGRHIPQVDAWDGSAGPMPASLLIGFLGTTSVQLSERKRGTPLPKRHQIKHLEFVIS